MRCLNIGLCPCRFRSGGLRRQKEALCMETKQNMLVDRAFRGCLRLFRRYARSAAGLFTMMDVAQRRQNRVHLGELSLCFLIPLFLSSPAAAVLSQDGSGICSALKLTVPSHIIHGIEGQPLHLSVDYNFNATASEIQIIWLFEGSQSNQKYFIVSVNETVVADLEYEDRFTLTPPNASLRIDPLHISDEGNYTVKVKVRGNGTIAASQKIQVAVDVPVTKPTVHTEPSSGVVEYIGNITLKCTVDKGTRVTYQWMKNGRCLHAGSNYTFSSNNATLLIVPVVKEDIGNYSCLVSNPVSAMESEIIAPTIYYGPYGIRVKSDKGLKIGAVFTLDMGEIVLFDCSADSNPPNTYSWVQRDNNTTQVIKYGPHLEVVADKVAQKTVDYACRAFNSMTGKRDETHFTVVITSVGVEELAQKGKSVSSLAVITGISLLLILAMAFLFLWKRYQPHKVIQRKLQSRAEADYRKARAFSGQENAADDFGIYEFVSFPDLTRRSRVSSQSIPDFVTDQDTLSTGYEVIEPITDQPQQDPTNNVCEDTGTGNESI